MGGFAGMIPVGAGAVDLPVEACGAGFFAEDAFGEGAPANIAEADHQYSFGRHGREGTIME